jgi:hypothetical protein
MTGMGYSSVVGSGKVCRYNMNQSSEDVDGANSKMPCISHASIAYSAQSAERLGQGLDDRSSIPSRGNNGTFFLFTTTSPDEIWGSPSLLSNGYLGQRGRDVNLTTHLHLMPRLKKVELYFHFPSILMAWCLVKHRDNFALPVSDNGLRPGNYNVAVEWLALMFSAREIPGSILGLETVCSD